MSVITTSLNGARNYLYRYSDHKSIELRTSEGLFQGFAHTLPPASDEDSWSPERRLPGPPVDQEPAAVYASTVFSFHLKLELIDLVANSVIRG
jgi:hypothetical protein